MAAKNPLMPLIRAAVDKAGNQNKLALALGLSRQTVNQWVKGNKVPAGEQVLALERYVGKGACVLCQMRCPSAGKHRSAAQFKQCPNHPRRIVATA
jgi:DNA-binding transcriptional regulator YdaS (Cro superfamily)